jgi:hypothetical protein
MQLKRRIADLEHRIAPPEAKRWVRIFQYEGQTKEQAVAAYEAEHGPINDNMGVILRVIISKPLPAPEHA